MIQIHYMTFSKNKYFVTLKFMFYFCQTSKVAHWGKGTFCQAGQLQFSTQVPHGGKRNQLLKVVLSTLYRYHGTSTRPTHTCTK